MELDDAMKLGKLKGVNVISAIRIILDYLQLWLCTRVFTFALLHVYSIATIQIESCGCARYLGVYNVAVKIKMWRKVKK